MVFATNFRNIEIFLAELYVYDGGLLTALWHSDKFRTAIFMVPVARLRAKLSVQIVQIGMLCKRVCELRL